MKKLNKFLCLILCVCMMIGTMAMTASAAKLPDGVVESDIRITVNDEFVEFPDTKPLIKSGRTLIPVRFVAELMGAEVTWDDANKTAVLVKGNTTVKIKIGDKNLRVIENGVERVEEMDTVAMIVNSRTVLPIRFVAEAFGAYVDWSSQYNICEIVFSDELTAEEIGRLRSYAPTNWYMASAPGEYNFSWYKEYGPSFEKYFTGAYGFANSHAFLMHSGITIGNRAKSSFTTTILPEGTNGKDYAGFCVDYVVNVLEQEKGAEIEATGKTNYDSWTYHKEGWLDVSYGFITCSGLVYHETAAPTRAVNVRGIMSVTFGEDCPQDWITDSFGIENPEYGKTYYLDTEFTVSRKSTSGAIAVAAAWYFDANGVAHAMKAVDRNDY